MPSSPEPVVVMTLMVRDEIDLIRTWLDYHLSQGFTQIIVTDNGSVDGTREVLGEYADAGRIELHDHLQQDKRQFEVVTGMARRASSEYGADWVLNSDADEFWVTENGEPVADALARLPEAKVSYPVQVVNMFGPVLESGFDITAAVWRDERSPEALHRVGLHAHPTQNLIHPGSDTVEVAQGNHFSSFEQAEALPADVGIEVLHFPMRSWQQYRGRVRVGGEIYASSPDLHPSPRHHLMRDYRWDAAGVLKMFYAARHPQGRRAEGFRQDTRLAKRLTDAGLRPGEAVALGPTEAAELDERFAQLDAVIVALEDERTAALAEADARILEAARQNESQHEAADGLQARIDELTAEVAELQRHNALQHERIEQLDDWADERELFLSRHEQMKERIRQLDQDLTRAEGELEDFRNRTIVRIAEAAKSPVDRIKGFLR
ncbi:glycosyltransferase family 2 protein [Gulosibacter sediminis]|uniref:glycosyltransferase family 2 protein n=1 Tax=Gulosibacter sediminis TaxID=1729695 RepID=UPI0024AE1C7E|nr:glycosyltransferase family 2 protein [Gulosibacter sediminis]